MIISNYKHSHDGSTKSYTSFVYIYRFLMLFILAKMNIPSQEPK